MISHDIMKEPALHRIRLRASNCYLLIGNGAVLIDAGLKGEGKVILKAMASRGVRPQDLRLILLTHGHADHAGAAGEMSTATGAPVVLRAEDARWVREGLLVPAPPVTGWARAISRLLSTRFMQGLMSAPRFTPDVSLAAEEISLAVYGVEARVIHTPGHTAGSVCVLLEDGRAIVGDLAMNGLPSSPFRPTPPIVAQDLPQLRRSWTIIGERGAKTIFPGHGASFAWASLEMSG